jgi:hypothetical protein
MDFGYHVQDLHNDERCEGDSDKIQERVLKKEESESDDYRT